MNMVYKVSTFSMTSMHSSTSLQQTTHVQLPEGLQKFAINDIERAQIAELKKRLHQHLTPRYDDIRICRFLRREKDVDRTEAMILREMKWRAEVNVDAIFENFPKHPLYKSLISYWPGSLHGVDRYGVPMLCERVGEVDLHSLLGAVSAELLLQFHIFAIERNDRIITEAFRRLGAPVGYIYFMDLTGLSIKHYSKASISILKQIQNIDDNYYPEFLRKVVVLNAPTVFSLFWKIGKTVMHEQSVAKWAVLKSNFQDEIRIHATPENVPRWMGGSCNSCPHHNNDCKFGGNKFVVLN